MNEENYQPKTSNVPITAMPLPLAVWACTVQVWTAFGVQAAQFMIDRFQEDINVRQALLTCASFEDLWRIQAELLTVAEQGYPNGLSGMHDLTHQLSTVNFSDTATEIEFENMPV